MTDEGGNKLKKLAGPGMSLGYAILTGNPVGMVVAAQRGMAAVFAPQDHTEVFLNEFADFVCVELTARVAALEQRSHAVDWKVDDLDGRVTEVDARLRKVIEELSGDPDLTATETAAVLHEVREVWSRCFDPEKRTLLGAALRSSLLDRNKYKGGLRKRFLKVLDELEFGDVVALAALVNPKDDKLVTAAGFAKAGTSTIRRPNHRSLARSHINHLKAQGVVSTEGNNPSATRLGELFLEFVDASPERLLSTYVAANPRPLSPEADSRS